MENAVMTDRFIVDKSALLQLFRFCSVEGCGSIIDQEDITFHEVGAAVVVKCTCLQNHEQSWSSSSSVGEGHHQLYVINILLASFTLFCGLNMSQVSFYIWFWFYPPWSDYSQLAHVLLLCMKHV